LEIQWVVHVLTDFVPCPLTGFVIKRTNHQGTTTTTAAAATAAATTTTGKLALVIVSNLNQHPAKRRRGQ